MMIAGASAQDAEMQLCFSDDWLAVYFMQCDLGKAAEGRILMRPSAAKLLCAR